MASEQAAEKRKRLSLSKNCKELSTLEFTNPGKAWEGEGSPGRRRRRVVKDEGDLMKAIKLSLVEQIHGEEKITPSKGSEEQGIQLDNLSMQKTAKSHRCSTDAASSEGDGSVSKNLDPTLAESMSNEAQSNMQPSNGAKSPKLSSKVVASDSEFEGADPIDDKDSYVESQSSELSSDSDDGDFGEDESDEDSPRSRKKKAAKGKKNATQSRARTQESKPKRKNVSAAKTSNMPSSAAENKTKSRGRPRSKAPIDGVAKITERKTGNSITNVRATSVNGGDVGSSAKASANSPTTVSENPTLPILPKNSTTGQTGPSKASMFAHPSVSAISMGCVSLPPRPGLSRPAGTVASSVTSGAGGVVSRGGMTGVKRPGLTKSAKVAPLHPRAGP